MKTRANIATLMSNAKWRKFFRVVARDSEHVSTATWKLVGEPEPLVGYLPGVKDIWETSVDNCLNGPVEYKQIEWVELPSKVEFRRYKGAPISVRAQDLGSVANALRAEAQFPLEDTPTGLRVHGYKLPVAP